MSSSEVGSSFPTHTHTNASFVSKNRFGNQKTEHCGFIKIILKIINLMSRILILLGLQSAAVSTHSTKVTNKLSSVVPQPLPPSLLPPPLLSSAVVPTKHIAAVPTHTTKVTNQLSSVVPSPLPPSPISPAAAPIRPVSSITPSLPPSAIISCSANAKPEKAVSSKHETLISKKCHLIIRHHAEGDGSSSNAGLIKLRQLEQAGNFPGIRSHHYDWWLFPIDRPSNSYGNKYQISNEECKSLIEHPGFISDYIEGVSIVLNAWGWKDGKYDGGQTKSTKYWNGYGIRLAKMADSLLLFSKNSKEGTPTHKILLETYVTVQQFYHQVVLPQHISKKQICSEFDFVQMYCDPPPAKIPK